MPIPVVPDVVWAGPGVPGEQLQTPTLTIGDLTLGVTDDQGVMWTLGALKGWFEPAGSSNPFSNRASDHGAWPAPSYLGPRMIEVEGALQAKTWEGAVAARSRLAAALPVSDLEMLYVSDGFETLQAEVRQGGELEATVAEGAARIVVEFSLSLFAPDPRRYSTGWTEAYTGLPTTSGGLSLPLTLPLSVGAVSTNGTLQAYNAGNMATRPTFTVQGPCPAFTITHLGSGKSLRFAEAIAAGRTLVIDTDKRLALLDGTARRVVSGTWFDYEPGNNEVSFSAATYDSAALLVSSHRSAWR